MHQYEKLNNQPLVIALAEFRFSTILQMESYISAFQDYLRQDFPHFSTMQQQEMIVEPNGIRVNSSTGWLFLSNNKKRAFILDKERLIFLNSEYDRFPHFLENCKTALAFIEREIKPALLLRVGLRYSDLIIAKEENEQIESYVQPEVCNIDSLGGIGEQIQQINETTLKTDEGIMAVRSLYGKLNLSVWHDLSEPPVMIHKDSQPSNRILLDFDHYWQPENEAPKFNVELISCKLNALHEGSREAFWKITTPNGREHWK